MEFSIGVKVNGTLTDISGLFLGGRCRSYGHTMDWKKVDVWFCWEMMKLLVFQFVLNWCCSGCYLVVIGWTELTRKSQEVGRCHPNGTFTGLICVEFWDLITSSCHDFLYTYMNDILLMKSTSEHQSYHHAVAVWWKHTSSTQEPPGGSHFDFSFHNHCRQCAEKYVMFLDIRDLGWFRCSSLFIFVFHMFKLFSTKHIFFFGEIYRCWRSSRRLAVQRWWRDAVSVHISLATWPTVFKASGQTLGMAQDSALKLPFFLNQQVGSKVPV